MFLWIGLGIEKLTEKEIRDYCKNLNLLYNVNEQSFTLPQHISLKTSFSVENYNDIVYFFKEKFKNNKKINLSIKKVDKVSGVIWLELDETLELRNYHNEIVNNLKKHFNIDKAKYDGDDFKFHSTLFQDIENEDKIDNLYNNIDKKLFQNKKIVADKIYFGISEVGKVGTYKVIDQLNLK